MALTATIFKAAVDISDIRRHYYRQHRLTLARHPSETDERMMLRLLAFALFANEELHFSRGLSNDDEPDLWQKSLSGEIELWIELGQPSEKRLKRALGLSKHVVILNYGGQEVQNWQQQFAATIQRESKLTVLSFSPQQSRALAELAQRNLSCQFTFDESSIWVSSQDSTIELQPLWQTEVFLPESSH
ncbi:YaeQ family protein [Spongiibacter sp. KMU-158]|uniref:YaeQ family protein n=1 Tax=Spongiibacter pelagi TaxID=2760804 RepID=A0A927GWB1_9GAMM|nr:YaeQ family protein [Spongiibacter pelagi]MBD2858244.1 YaeQ family protein [Spongiibacter pelagi]